MEGKQDQNVLESDKILPICGQPIKGQDWAVNWDIWPFCLSHWQWNQGRSSWILQKLGWLFNVPHTVISRLSHWTFQCNKSSEWVIASVAFVTQWTGHKYKIKKISLTFLYMRFKIVANMCTSKELSVNQMEHFPPKDCVNYMPGESHPLTYSKCISYDYSSLIMFTWNSLCFEVLKNVFMFNI